MTDRINLVHLYPREMNIYGDSGNILVLQVRLQSRGYEVDIKRVGVGDKIPRSADIIVGGGGQDSGQIVVATDLQTKSKSLFSLSEDNVVMLMVCGMYQLFGRKFVTSDERTIEGIGLLPLVTVAGTTRMIGNTLYETPWGEVVGYENHSGQTTLDSPDMALGRVLRGAGNNGSDHTEGCLVSNVFGTYSHGPVLSKNPKLADELILRALKRRYGIEELPELDDRLEMQAAEIAKGRPR